MGEMKVKLSDETEEMFRKSAIETFGYTKGSLGEAAEQGLERVVVGRFDVLQKDFQILLRLGRAQVGGGVEGLVVPAPLIEDQAHLELGVGDRS